METPVANFCLPDQDGTTHCLDAYRGKWVLLYFYPKDLTPGCTHEACAIRDLWDEFKKYNAVVLGVSSDSVASHKKFAEKHTLPFPLLSDTEKTVLQQFKVIKNTSIFGKTALSVSRESFLIDPTGALAKHYKKVEPKKHAAEVLADLEAFTKK